MLDSLKQSYTQFTQSTKKLVKISTTKLDKVYVNVVSVEETPNYLKLVIESDECTMEKYIPHSTMVYYQVQDMKPQ